MSSIKNILFGSIAALAAATMMTAPAAALAPAGAYVAQWLQSFRDFPPRQKPGSFSLDRVMEAVTTGGRQGDN
jgi:hypothetical protein